MENKMSYIIKDTLGGYAWTYSLGIWPKDLDDKSKGKEYFYMSCKWSNRGTMRKETAERIVEKLRKTNELMGFEGLDWEIIFVTEEKDLDFKFTELSKEERKKQGEYFFLTKPIPRGKKTTPKKDIKQIRKEYAS